MLPLSAPFGVEAIERDLSQIGESRARKSRNLSLLRRTCKVVGRGKPAGI